MWEIITVKTFDAWFLALSHAEQVDVLASMQLLGIKGPHLGRPYADTLEGSRIHNLKELRIQHQGRPYRVFFAFDPERKAVLLCGGDKTGDKRFYKRLIPIAEQEFQHYLENRTV
jgi:hypothetical protein